MTKWVGSLFPVTLDDGSKQSVYGPAYKGLAIVRTSKGMYALFHMKSSAKLMTISGDYPSVKKFAAAIADITEWDRFERKDEILADAGIVKKVTATREFFSTNHNKVSLQ